MVVAVGLLQPLLHLLARVGQLGPLLAELLALGAQFVAIPVGLLQRVAQRVAFRRELLDRRTERRLLRGQV